MSNGESGKPLNHVAIIMDGNGRWAMQRSLPRSAGHRQGIESVRSTVKACIDTGIAYLTIYAFSTENWSRPKSEVTFLMDLMRRFIKQDVGELHRAGVKIRIIGERDKLDATTLRLLEDAESLTCNNTVMHLMVAFNYGSRQEIVRAVKSIASQVLSGDLPVGDISPELLSRTLDTGECPDPDLLIRTGGEMRISNFLLWQTAYSEFVFVPEHWPDFTREVFQRCVEEYYNRERRFGGLVAQRA